jgi:hypothetical protein
VVTLIEGPHVAFDDSHATPGWAELFSGMAGVSKDSASWITIAECWLLLGRPGFSQTGDG